MAQGNDNERTTPAQLPAPDEYAHVTGPTIPRDHGIPPVDPEAAPPNVPPTLLSPREMTAWLIAYQFTRYSVIFARVTSAWRGPRMIYVWAREVGDVAEYAEHRYTRELTREQFEGAHIEEADDQMWHPGDAYGKVPTGTNSNWPVLNWPQSL